MPILLILSLIVEFYPNRDFYQHAKASPHHKIFLALFQFGFSTIFSVVLLSLVGSILATTVSSYLWWLVGLVVIMALVIVLPCALIGYMITRAAGVSFWEFTPWVTVVFWVVALPILYLLTDSGVSGLQSWSSGLNIPYFQGR